MKNIIPCIVLLASSVLASNAQPIAVRASDKIDLLTHTQPKVYQDQMVIRVHTTTQAQLDAVLGLTESTWSERVGIGPLEVQVKRSSLDTLADLGIAYEVLIADLQAHADATWNTLVEAERFQRTQPNTNRGAAVHDDSFFANYQQLNDITAYINNVVAIRPDLASAGVIGQSYEGRDMFAVTLTSPDTVENPVADRSVIFIFSNVHAREWIAPMTTTYFISKFVQEYDTDPRVQSLLESNRIVIVPLSNPDGYLYTWSDSRFWRKNRRDNFTGRFGVDINRNWGYEWGGQGSSGNTSSDTYRGASPFSEPETQALRDLALSYGDKLAAHIDYHSYSQLILWPFGYADGVMTPEPYRTYFDALSHDLADEIRSVHGKRYNPIQSVDLYAAAGDSSDWFFGQLGVQSLTIELRPDVGGFAPPPETIFPNAQENYLAFKRYIELATGPLFLSQQNESTTPSGTPITLAALAIDGAQIVDPDSATLYVQSSLDFTYQPIDMALVGDSAYEAIAPALACGDSYNYYFAFSTLDGSTFTLPTQGVDSPFTILAEDIVPFFADTLETDTGWIVGADTDEATSGIWTLMDPQGNGAQPEDDHTPDGTMCWVTDGIAGVDQNDRDVDGGSTTLTSPVFDAASPGIAQMSFWYAIKTGFGSNFDDLEVKLSNDAGKNWIDYAKLQSTNAVWQEFTFTIEDIIEPTNQMRVRFVMSDLFGDQVVEAAIDDLRIDYIGCKPSNPADLNHDGQLNFFDVSIFLDAFNNRDPLADFTQDGHWNFFDVSAFLVAFNKG